MAKISGYEYVTITNPATSTAEDVPVDWAYYAGSDTGWTLKPDVPWPSEDAPVECYFPKGIVPTSWDDGYGNLMPGHTLPIKMPDGPYDGQSGGGGGSTAENEVADFLGRTGDAALIALAERHRPIVEQYVYAYVRGNGVTIEEDGSYTFPADLAAVVVTATARLVVNPAQVERESADGYSVTGSFSGFSLPEVMVLNRYRRRSA